jgi:hypothetical protein
VSSERRRSPGGAATARCADSGHRLPTGVRLFATQTGYDRLGIFNYLVGRGEDQRRDSEAERPGGLEVDDEFECGRLLNRKISMLSSLQGAVDIASGAAKDLEDAGAVGDEQARRTRGPPLIAGSSAAAMSAAFDARNGSLSTMSASGLACVIAAMYYSSLMSRTYLCARLLETLD